MRVGGWVEEVEEARGGDADSRRGMRKAANELHLAAGSALGTTPTGHNVDKTPPRMGQGRMEAMGESRRWRKTEAKGEEEAREAAREAARGHRPQATGDRRQAMGDGQGGVEAVCGAGRIGNWK